MVEIHMLLNPHISDAWFAQSVESLVEAADNAPYVVNYNMFDPIEGHVGRARKEAFEESDAPYVGFLDPDDWITVNTFIDLYPVIRDGLPAGRTKGNLVYPDGRVQQTATCGLFICKREFVDLIDWEAHDTACKPGKPCGTCELQRIAAPEIMGGYDFFRRYGYGSWASKNTRKT